MDEVGQRHVETSNDLSHQKLQPKTCFLTLWSTWQDILKTIFWLSSIFLQFVQIWGRFHKDILDRSEGLGQSYIC